MPFKIDFKPIADRYCNKSMKIFCKLFVQGIQGSTTLLGTL